MTIIQQGRFTSDGSAKTLSIRSDVDWMRVYNYTQMLADAADTGYEFYWQRGLADGYGFEYQSNATNNAIDLVALTTGGFTLIDSSGTTQPARVALTGLTAANPAVITSAAHGLSVGDVVRFTSLDNQDQLSGLDFSVTAVGGVNQFTVGNINMANSTASTAGFWRKIDFDPLYYPRRRYVTYVSQSATAGRAKIYFSVAHGFTVGQEVRLSFKGSVWEEFQQLDNRIATIVAVNEARAGNEPNNGGTANNIVVDVDVSALGNWNVFGDNNDQAYPDDADVPFTPAQVVPVGEDTAQALSSSVDILGDATYNTGYLGMRLAAGQDSPAGQANDVIYWTAGKAFSVTNE